MTPAEQAADAADEALNPSHYRSHPSGVEAITITEHFGFNCGNAIKYIWRAGLKSPDALTDLRKAAWYLDREIRRLGGAPAREVDADVAEACAEHARRERDAAEEEGRRLQDRINRLMAGAENRRANHASEIAELRDKLDEAMTERDEAHANLDDAIDEADALALLVASFAAEVRVLRDLLADAETERDMALIAYRDAGLRERVERGAA